MKIKYSVMYAERDNTGVSPNWGFLYSYDSKEDAANRVAEEIQFDIEHGDTYAYMVITEVF